jgi:hypothetical protein
MKSVVIIISFCFVFGHSVSNSCFAQAKPKEDKRVKQLDDEKRKLARTTNPESRAKSLMRVAEITLSYVNEAVRAGDFSKMQLYVDQYCEAVAGARDAMMKSGFDPHKKSGGYKAVEIALRKQIRVLQDISRTLTVDERQPVDEAIDLTSQTRDEFMKALFR